MASTPMSLYLAGKQPAAEPTHPVKQMLTTGQAPTPQVPEPANTPMAHFLTTGETPKQVQTRNALTAEATKIATSAHLDPAFVKHLQAQQAADPTFQSRLNAEVKRVSSGIEAKRNSGVAGIVGQTVEGMANPLEWAQGAVHGVGQLKRGVQQGDIGQAVLGSVGVLGVLPMGRLAKAGEAIGLAVKGARTADEASAHVAEAAQAARAAGHGLPVKQAVIVKPGEVTAETGGQLGAQVRQALKGAQEARAQQDALYSAERGKRVAKVAGALTKSDPQAALTEALGHLKGELPKIDFQGFKQLDQHAVTAMIGHIKDSPDLQPLDKVTAAESILHAAEGKVPTKSEQAILERVFGRETAQGVSELSMLKKVGRGITEVLNVPRAIQAAFDLSAPFRQGLVAAVTHPRIFLSEFRPMLKAAGSEKFFQGLQEEIHARPTYPLMAKAKLSLTDIGTDAQHGAKLADREEQFMSNLAERIPGIGHGVRFSDRAYVGFLNKLRADVFDSLVHEAAMNGRDLNAPGELESIGKIVNAFTGRGDIGKLQRAAPLLNTVFFSPRLLASRLNLIFGVGTHGIPGEFYASLSPFARMRALEGVRNLIGTTSLILWLAKLNGATVNLDPTNADFGKIKIHNTRLDILGGFQQPVRLMAELFEGHITSSTTGKRIAITQEGFGKLSRKDIVQRFIESKYAPVPSLINDVMSNKTFEGQPLTVNGEAYNHLMPLLAQDVIDLQRQSGPLAAAGGAIPGLFGVGLQTYSAKKPKSKSSSGFWGTGSASTSHSSSFWSK